VSGYSGRFSHSKATKPPHSKRTRIDTKGASSWQTL
jgi:hypothetical protein